MGALHTRLGPMTGPMQAGAAADVRRHMSVASASVWGQHTGPPLLPCKRMAMPLSSPHAARRKQPV